MSVTVVNMIPKSLSAEHNQDSEPNLAVNPNNTLQMAATAFTPNPTGGAMAPIFVSSDGGATWSLNAIVPGAASLPTFDITAKFGGTSNDLYAGIIRADNTNLAILRTSNYLSATPMTVLLTRAPAGGGIDDQPWIQATTATSVSGSPDRVYVGSNDQLTSPKSAHIDQSLNATGAAPAGFSAAGITIASRSAGGGENGPSIRPSIHSSGRIYAAYFNWTAFSGNSSSANITSDVVVCRDDNWGSGANPYTALVDSADHLAGVRVVRGSPSPGATSASSDRSAPAPTSPSPSTPPTAASSISPGATSPPEPPPTPSISAGPRTRASPGPPTSAPSPTASTPRSPSTPRATSASSTRPSPAPEPPGRPTSKSPPTSSPPPPPPPCSPPYPPPPPAQASILTSATTSISMP